jgi:glycosyltransferase involved in cell wall biosynthesis
MYDLSIVIPTVGREKEVRLLLQSISDTITDRLSYEIIIVDQNADDLLLSAIHDAKNSNIKYFKVPFRGLSKAKNYGMKQALGRFICFPDDDCRMLENSIEIALNLLITNQYDMVTGRCADETGNDSILRFHTSSADLTIDNFEGRMVEPAIFAKRELMLEYCFDETLGVGTFHGAEEGFDLIYRLLKDKKRIFYSPDICLYHPQVILDKSEAKSILRAFTYRCGLGRVCVKHKLYRKLLKRLFAVLLFIPFCAMFRRNSLRFYLAEMLGILSGIIVKPTTNE